MLHIRCETEWKVAIFKRKWYYTQSPWLRRPITCRTHNQKAQKKSRRNPLRSTTKVSPTSMRRVLMRDELKTLSYKMQKQHKLTAVNKFMRFARCRHILDQMRNGTLQTLVFINEKKFDVQHAINHQNDGVWRRNGSVECRPANQRQCPLSVIVRAAVTATRRSER